MCVQFCLYFDLLQTSPNIKHRKFFFFLNSVVNIPRFMFHLYLQKKNIFRPRLHFFVAIFEVFTFDNM